MLLLAPRNNQTRLTVLPEHGGLCHQLEFTLADGSALPVLAACTEAELAQGNPWYRGAWLYPFPSRLAEGRYQWQGKTYQFPINEPERGNALHGFLNRLRMQVADHVIEENSARVKLVCDYDGTEPGYPFPARLSLVYDIDDRGSLVATMTVTNRHSTAVPLGIGWHPYLALDGLLDDWMLQLPAGEQVVLDERLLPSGTSSAFHSFDTLSRLGDLVIDAPLELPATSAGRVEAKLWSPQKNAGVVLWQDTGNDEMPGFRYLQLFIPPDRNAIALEPVSCGINAFNTGVNLCALSPGAAATYTCGIDFIEQVPIDDTP